MGNLSKAHAHLRKSEKLVECSSEGFITRERIRDLNMIAEAHIAIARTYVMIELVAQIRDAISTYRARVS